MGENVNGMFYNTLEHAATETHKMFLQVCESEAVSKKCFLTDSNDFERKILLAIYFYQKDRQQSQQETTSSKLQS